MAQLSFQRAPLVLTEIPGPKSKRAYERQSRFETQSRVYSNYFPIAIDQARGSTVKDVDGNVYVDWYIGVCVQNLGHAHPVVVEAIKRQMEQIVHSIDLPFETRIEFVEGLVGTLPGDLKNDAKVLFTVTGADACEAAVSLARKVTGRKAIVAFGGAYHGIHGAIVGATANYHYRDFAGVPAYETYHIPYPYRYRFPFKSKEGEESGAVIDYLEYMIKDSHSGVGPLAGIIVEPIQGEGGYIVPPDDFLPMLAEVSQKHSIPLIVDEVQTGVGRTGKMWASEWARIDPDIVCISKSIGGGVPLSMIAYRPEYDDLPPGFHLGTYRGNALGIAAGNAVLKFLGSSGVLERVRTDGEVVKKRFEEICEGNPMVGEVRGKGFMVGIELVNDKNSRTPATKLASDLRTEMLHRGLLMHTCGHFGNVLRFMAPLTIEDPMLDAGFAVFEDSLNALTNSSKSR
ncbi:MAG TPA: aspartate aminotransferase family protein [Nitrososphaerales archaeon]|nr:aspartate aminotransferase family protein [Nitrososphaerales archaeon]